MKIVLGILLIALMSISVSLYSQIRHSKKKIREQKQQLEFEEIQQLVASDSIEFIAAWAYPLGYKNMNLIGNTNFMRIQKDSVDADIPYFGRAFSIMPGERGGIYFNTIMEKKRVNIDKIKREVTISFNAKNKGRFYSCILRIYYNGSADLSVASNHLQQISYSGKVKKYKLEKHNE